MTTVANWLPELLGPHALTQDGGDAVTARPTWNIVGATLTDDSVNERTDIDVGSHASGTMRVANPLGTFWYAFAGSAIVADRTLTLPLLTGADTVCVLSLAQTLTNKTLTSPIILGQTQGAAVAVAAMAIDWAAGPVQTKTLAAGANVFTFSNQASGMSITVRVTGAASTLTWPTVKWAGGVPPTQTASGIDVYTFVHDGTSIYGSVVQAMA